MFINNAHAQITPQQQEVLDDYLVMKDMNGDERRDYRKQVFANKSPEQSRAYSRAFKQVRPMLASYLGYANGELPSDTTAKTSASSHEKGAHRVPGTSIQYDSGNVTGTSGVASQMVGNRFDSALNPPGTMCCFPVESTGTITMATFNMVNTQFNSAVYSLYTNIMGTTAQQVTSMGMPGIMTGLNTLTFGTMTMGNYANGAFLAGIWQFNIGNTALGVDTGTTGGQGFHGISLNDGAMASMLTDLMSLNAVFRVQGNVATPVELINFTVE